MRPDPAADPERPRRLRLMTDWEAQLPVWGEWGGLGEHDLLALGVTAGLLQDLEDWQARWNAGIDADTGRLPLRMRARHRREGRSLHRRLRAQLPDISVDFQP